jgi:hypothetical protein
MKNLWLISIFMLNFLSNTSICSAQPPKVAIIDTGFSHPYVAPFLDFSKACNVTPECTLFSRVNVNESILDTSVVDFRSLSFSSHGTHVAGIFARVAELNPFYPEQVIVPIKVNAKRACVESFINALEIIKSMKDVLIINISWKIFNTLDPSLEIKFRTIVKEVAESGKLIVCSAGNDGRVWGELDRHCPMIELAHELKGRLIIVGACDGTNYQFADFSDRCNDCVKEFFVTAPGVNVESCVPPTFANPYGFARYNGTSMAAPYVAGVLFRMLKECPDLDIDDASRILRETVCTHIQDLPLDECYGSGIVQKNKAIYTAKMDYPSYTIVETGEKISIVTVAYNQFESDGVSRIILEGKNYFVDNENLTLTRILD